MKKQKRPVIPATALVLSLLTGAAPALMGQYVDSLVLSKVEPVVITVGGPSADIQGFNSKSIQLALDALKTRGGGTVRLGPGKYDITGPVRMHSNTALEGSGAETVLQKSKGFKTSFTIDADYGMMKVTVADASGFAVGNGVSLWDDDNNQGWDVTTSVITAIDGNVLYLSSPTLNDYIASKNGVVANTFNPVEGVGVENVRISNLTIDGDKATNAYVDGCRVGGVYLHKARNCTVEGVHVTNFNGDSFSWQITENITVRNCEASNGGGLGFHPGTGSDRSVVEKNRSHHNLQDGIFLCWRVQNGIFRDNVSYANQRHGISIGHQDTDNLFVGNHVYDNDGNGVFFRMETEQNGGHRNTFRGNTVEGNGRGEQGGYGFYVGGNTFDITIEGNVIRSEPEAGQKAALYIGDKAKRVTFRNNQVTGPEKE